MNIKPSASIRQNYAVTKREKMLKLREELLNIEEDRFYGTPDYSVGEVVSMMEQSIREVYHART